MSAKNVNFVTYICIFTYTIYFSSIQTIKYHKKGTISKQNYNLQTFMVHFLSANITCIREGRGELGEQ